MPELVETDRPSLAACRKYLRLHAQHHLGKRLRSKLDASDIAQQAILQAHAHREQFYGTTEAEWLGWLRSIVANVVGTVAHEFDTAARQVSRELSLHAERDNTSTRLEVLLADQRSTPTA